jgi:hypothetical protein
MARTRTREPFTEQPPESHLDGIAISPARLGHHRSSLAAHVGLGPALARPGQPVPGNGQANMRGPPIARVGAGGNNLPRASNLLAALECAGGLARKGALQKHGASMKKSGR